MLFSRKICTQSNPFSASLRATKVRIHVCNAIGEENFHRSVFSLPIVVSITTCGIKEIWVKLTGVIRRYTTNWILHCFTQMDTDMIWLNRIYSLCHLWIISLVILLLTKQTINKWDKSFCLIIIKRFSFLGTYTFCEYYIIFEGQYT